MTDTALALHRATVDRRRHAPRREAIAVYAVVLLMAAVATAIIWPSPLTYDGAALTPVWLFFGVAAVIGMLLHQRGMIATGNGIELIAAFMLVSMMTSFTSAALAWTALPLADGALRAADAMLGFSWPAMIDAVRGDTGALTVLSYVYVSLGPQPFVLIVLLVATRRLDAAWRFVAAWAIALLLTLAIFPFVPALGNVAANHIAWGAIPGIRSPAAWDFPRALSALRDGHMTMLGDDALGGIIAFPSFHTAGAVLLGWGFLQLRWIRFPAILLNLLMIASALVIGGHYLVDLIAGGLVAGTAIAISGRLTTPVRTAARSPG